MRPRLIVLKLGGSVLKNEASLASAVHEIYRWRRDGFGVVAVVSAFAGETDRLLARAASHGANAWSTAATAATGELVAAALLGAALDRAGVPASVLTPAALGFVADGPPLEAAPTALDRRRLVRALEREGVAVVPGFSALDVHGRTVLLGRGGSDLSALFLAGALGARCRLLKDVGRLHEADPAQPGPRPRCYAKASWEDALATDGTILQHRAVRFARERGLAFELAAPGGIDATLVGPGPSEFRRSPARSSPLRIVLLGHGTVGAGVWTRARELAGILKVVAVCCRDHRRAQENGVPAALLRSDPSAAVRQEAELVVECLGGREPARSALVAALAAGRHVVTANKLVLAEDGAELQRLASERGARLLGSAAVGGSAPVLERVVALGRRVRAVRGVLNGTANLVLERLSFGASLESALDEARERGLAERDPGRGRGRDLDGSDAAAKLRVIAAALGAQRIDVAREPLDASAASRACAARASGRRLRQVAELAFDGQGARASVRLVELGHEDALFDLPEVQNSAVLYGDRGVLERVGGIGAGRWPTAEAVLGDLLEIERATRATRSASPPNDAEVQASWCGLASASDAYARDSRSDPTAAEPSAVDFDEALSA